MLDLKRYVPLERCRLVKYDHFSKILEQSFEKQEVGEENYTTMCGWIISDELCEVVIGATFTLHVVYGNSVCLCMYWGIQWIKILCIWINPMNAIGVYIYIYMPNLYIPWVRTAYLYPCVMFGPYCAKKRSLLGTFSDNCWGHAFSLTSLSRISRKGW